MEGKRISISRMFNRKIITEELGGNILLGVTHSSVMEMLKSWNVSTSVRRISLDEL